MLLLVLVLLLFFSSFFCSFVYLSEWKVQKKKSNRTKITTQTGKQKCEVGKVFFRSKFFVITKYYSNYFKFVNICFKFNVLIRKFLDSDLKLFYQNVLFQTDFDWYGLIYPNQTNRNYAFSVFTIATEKGCMKPNSYKIRNVIKWNNA